MQSTQLETLGRGCSYSLLVGGLKLLPATIIGKDYNLYFACLMILLTGGGSQLFVATLAGSWERWSTDSYSKPRKWTWLDDSDDKVAFRWEKSRAVEEAEGCKPWLSRSQTFTFVVLLIIPNDSTATRLFTITSAGIPWAGGIYVKNVVQKGRRANANESWPFWLTNYVNSPNSQLQNIVCLKEFVQLSKISAYPAQYGLKCCGFFVIFDKSRRPNVFIVFVL